jgi:hypothetical protein
MNADDRIAAQVWRSTCMNYFMTAASDSMAIFGVMLWSAAWRRAAPCIPKSERYYLIISLWRV